MDKKAKQKVRFNLEEEGKRNLDNASAHLDKNIENFPDNITSPLELACEDINHNKNVPTENDGIAANLSIISVSVESEFKEIDHGNKVRLEFAGKIVMSARYNNTESKSILK